MPTVRDKTRTALRRKSASSIASIVEERATNSNRQLPLAAARHNSKVTALGGDDQLLAFFPAMKNPRRSKLCSDPSSRCEPLIPTKRTRGPLRAISTSRTQ